MEKPRQRNYVKATNKEVGEPRYSQNWVTAKRTFFCVFSDRIEIGSWIIPFDEIKDVVLFKTKQMFIPISVLNIQTEEKNYQIGFNPWVNPVKNIPLDIRQENIHLKYSAFSVAVRIVLIGYIIYLIYGEWQ